MEKDARYIRWFEEIKIGDIPTVGGKNASLGEMYRELASQGVKIPNGFAITAEAYWYPEFPKRCNDEKLLSV
jgi:pyruvate,water dikinase